MLAFSSEKICSMCGLVLANLGRTKEALETFALAQMREVRDMNDLGRALKEARDPIVPDVASSFGEGLLWDYVEMARKTLRRLEREAQKAAIGINSGKGKSTAKGKSCSACGKQSSSLLLCSRCKQARYCDAGCQHKHWPQHKQQCK